MLTTSDIHYRFKETDTKIEVIAEIRLTKSINVDKSFPFGYSNKEIVINSAKSALQQEFTNHIYGKIIKDAQQAFLKIKEILSLAKNLYGGDYNNFENAIRPLLNISIEEKEK